MEGRDRSTTPTPLLLRSTTPSHDSQQTEDEHGEGQGPLSPSPWSPDFPYDAERRERTDALERVEEHFPADQQSRVDAAFRGDTRPAREGSTP